MLRDNGGVNEMTSPAPYAHWMLREIHEQPTTLRATLARYVEAGAFRAETCEPLRAWLGGARGGVLIAASGSSRHAGIAAEVLIEALSGLAVDVEYASEYVYRTEHKAATGAVMVVSQSGETADTLAALRKAKLAGRPVLAMTNVAESTMAREADASFPTEAGRERAVPATKSFTAQLLNMALLALLAAEVSEAMSADQLRAALAALERLPEVVAAQIDGWESAVRAIAPAYAGAASFLFLGRGVHYPIAREGALKLKESAYISAEGYPSGELKHGPNALVAEGTPLVMLATVDRADADSVVRYERVVQLMRDMRAQGADVLAIANGGDEVVAGLATHTVFVDPMPEMLLPICEVIPLQLLAYCMAVQAGIDVDRPRNLTKAVLAE
jgi:glucosamine--fructose-6-phosphate aminotransferase (isomerizing)